MTKRSKYICLFLLLFQTTFASTIFAQKNTEKIVFRLAGIFGNNMVLQRETDAAVWGYAKPGATVTIKPTWSDETVTTTANEDGKWKTTIATPEAGGPFQIGFHSNNYKINLKNVMSGEVWICSGQSNMQWRMRGFGLKHFQAAVEKANQPNIRLGYVPQVLSLEPQEDIRVGWTACSPKTVLQFSAVAYFFANKLEQELDGVPIGLVSTSWGGSAAQAWVEKEALLEQCPEFGEVYDEYPATIEKLGVLHPIRKRPKGINQSLPSALYNNMIRPIVPFTCRGVIWYQGESNVKDPAQYQRIFPTLIKSWRDEWGQGDFPFYYVQIAPYHYRNEELPAALLRESQFKALEIENTGMVVTMDIGDPTNIHPKRKQPVGERLAMLALAHEYGQTDLVYSGPQYVAHEVVNGGIQIEFTHTGSGMTSRDGKPLSHFTIAGADQVFHPASAAIENDTIVVSSPQVAKPVAVRFAWGNADEPNLMNQEGLPSSSFRTDDWPYNDSNKK